MTATIDDRAHSANSDFLVGCDSGGKNMVMLSASSRSMGAVFPLNLFSSKMSRVI